MWTGVLIIRTKIRSYSSSMTTSRFAKFESAAEFLAHPRVNGPRCLVLDVTLPGLGGLDLQPSLIDRSAISADHFHHRLWRCPDQRPRDEGRRMRVLDKAVFR
jgi:hypothetical protein